MSAVLKMGLVAGVLGMLLAGCAGTNPNTSSAVLAAGVDLVQCTPEEYGAFKSAVQNGGASWFAAVLETIQCAGKVYTDVNATLKLTELEHRDVEQLVASASDEVAFAVTVNTGETWSKRGLKRLLKCRNLARSMGVGP